MAQIESQIEVLNEDFRRMNADAVNTPTAFQSVATDVGVEFFLACVDPDGNPTNGVVRKHGQSVYTRVTEPGGTNESATGIKLGSNGSPAWPTDRYLNIWVCNLAENLLGYAQFPSEYSSKPTTDGVVVRTTAFGRTGYVVAPYNSGRTTTHEIGHWLNLRHIWGDNHSCGGIGDEVSDTPDQQNEYRGCPSFPQSSCGSNDMFMNYMDYTYDACMNLFTDGQKTRMIALFSSGGVRNSFVNNTLGMTVSGAELVCSSENYGVTSLPPGSTVTWSSSNPSLLSINSSTGAATKVGSSGQVTVTATVTSCGNIEIKKTVWVGPPNLVRTVDNVDLPIGVLAVYPSGTHTIRASSSSPSTTFTYEDTGGSGDMSISLSPLSGPVSYMDVHGWSTYGDRIVKVTATNACGSVWSNLVFYIPTFFRAVYPNPATNSLTLEFNSLAESEKLPDAIELVHEKNLSKTVTIAVKDIVKDSKNLRDNTYQLDISKLERGVWYLRAVKDGQKTESTRLLFE